MWTGRLSREAEADIPEGKAEDKAIDLDQAADQGEEISPIKDQEDNKPEVLKRISLSLFLMVEYKIVKHCRLCKVRFVVQKEESKKNYCDKCIKRLQNQKDD